MSVCSCRNFLSRTDGEPEGASQGPLEGHVFFFWKAFLVATC